MNYRKKVKANWKSIKSIQNHLERKLKNNEKGYIDSVNMVAGELLENSIKYYMKKEKKKSLSFFFSNKDDVIISILNQEIDNEDLPSVIDLIDEINCSSNPYNLYIDRLQEIIDNRVKGENRLGLLRVVSDGGYTLRYKLSNNKLSIYASKKLVGEDMQMKKLVYEDLTIEVTEQQNHYEISWIGQCRTLNPEFILDSYLAEVSQFLKGKKAVITFKKLDSMNSSTVPPLLTFIKTLEESAIDAEFVYNDEEDWQRASFKPLSIITAKYKHVVIKPQSTYKLV